MTAPDRRRVPFRAGGRARGVPLLVQEATYLADVSEFQPYLNDSLYLAWSKAVIIRAMYGDAHDDDAWYNGARRADLWAGGAQFLGIYQYITAWQDAAAQAGALVKLLGPLRPGEMVIGDLEEGGGNQAPRLAAWRAVIHKAYPWILDTPSGHAWCYSGLDFSVAHGLEPDWLADYTFTEPTSPAHHAWQFTDRYPVPGVGTADCSMFHGSVAELRALITPKAAPVPPPAPGPQPQPQPGSAPVPAPALEDDVMMLSNGTGAITVETFSGGSHQEMWFASDTGLAGNGPVTLRCAAYSNHKGWSQVEPGLVVDGTVTGKARVAFTFAETDVSAVSVQRASKGAADDTPVAYSF